MDFKLGIPGTYAGATLGPFGGNVILGGAGGGTRADYRITTIDIGNNTRSSVFLAGMASVTLRNLTFVNDVAPPLGGSIVRCHDSGVTIDGCDWDSIVGNNLSFFIVSLQGGNCAAAAGNFTFNGRNLPLGGIIQTDTSATYIGCLDIRGANYYFNNIPAGVAQFAASSVSTIRMQVSNLFSTNCTGVEYIVTENSIINMQGQTCPGTIAGVKASGGQFIP
jgi:hypothetical protein